MVSGKTRLKTVLNGQIPDRVPLDLGGINSSTMHWKVEKKLLEYLGYDYTKSTIISVDQQVVVPDERLLDHFRVDTRCLYLNEATPWREGSGGVMYDQWGIGRVFDGNYWAMREHPLASARTRRDLDAYRWPDPRSEARLVGLEERAKSYDDKYCLILEGFREVSFGLPSWIRGMSEFYMDLAADPGFANDFLDRLLAWNLELINFAMQRLGKYIDIVKIADDLGTQNSLLLSPDMYREFIKPRHTRLVAEIKKYGKPILLHSCGAVRPLIPDFIEIGIDALNPVQISAVGMDPAGLKLDFGDRIVLWGGGIDTQKSLPRATPVQIMEEVARNMDILKRGGRYVFAQVHNIQPDVPVENVIAMLEAYREHCRY